MKPILKWVGGKSWLVPYLEHYFRIDKQLVEYQLSMIDLVFEQQVGRYLVLHETHCAAGSLQHSG